MDKNLFPPRAGDTPFADRMPRMERPLTDGAPTVDCPQEGPHHNGGCGCGCGCEGNSAGNCGCMGYEGCGDHSWGLSEYPLAMVYAPCQQFRALYDTATALSRGTLFTELDLPLGGDCGFTAMGCACRAERRRV